MQNTLRSFQCFSVLASMNFIDLQRWVHILASSSLHHAVNSLPYSSKKQFLGKVTSVHGFSFNRNSKNWFKNAKNLQKGHLGKRKDLVVWHDLINNTISRHRSNNYQPCSVPESTSFLRTNKKPLQGYCLLSSYRHRGYFSGAAEV